VTLHPATRLVLVLGVLLTAGTGVGMVLAADRSADFWAWTIRNPLTAGAIGAGYCGAATGLAVAAAVNDWRRARPVVLAALTLTTLSLLATLRHLDEFTLDADDALPRAVAWTWLAVYVALPPLLALVTVLEERRPARREARPRPSGWGRGRSRWPCWA
jgi:hypothetical protein